MAKTKKRHIGDIGESLACRFIERRGSRVLERNYWKPWGEIDIVSENKGILYFVEVKTVSREIQAGEISPSAMVGQARWGTGLRPEENMHAAKIARLHRAIQSYLMEKNVPEGENWQLDLACVYLDFDTKKAKIELLENIIL